jgi:PAS domain S-box-containing protein
MGKPLHVLIVENSEDDALLMIRALKKGGYKLVYERVEDAEAMRKALREKTWDVILCDYRLPHFNGLAAIALLKDTGIDLPLIIVSGAIGEETAADCMRYGAHDYIMKNNLTRLVPAIERELKEAETRGKKKEVEEALRASEEKYRSLLDNASDAIFLADVEGNLLEINKKAKELLGYSKEEISGIHISRIHPAEVFEKIKDTFNEIVTKGSGYIDDASVLRKDGKIIPVDISGSLVERAVTKVVMGIFRNITERKHAEEALRESEEKFRKAFYTSTDVVSINRLEDGMYISINPGFTRIMGYTEEDIIGKTSIECNIWDNVEDRQRLIVGLKKDGDVINLEAAFRTKGGEIRYGLVSGSVIDLNGVPHILGVVRDITDRKRVEEVLRENEEKYRTIIENMEDGYHEVDIKGNFTFFNESMRKIIGYEREELLGMNNRQYAGDEENARKIYQVYNQVYRTGEPVKDFEWQIIRKDGDRRDIEVSISLIRDGEDHPTGFRGIVRDTTERKRAADALKESESKYRLLADNIHDVIFVFDMNLNYTYVSPSLKTLRGYEPEDVLEKQTSFDAFLTPASRDLAIITMSEVLEIEKSDHKDINMSRTLELELRRKDGTTVWAEVKLSFIRDENQRAVAILGVSRDISERKKAEEALLESEVQLRATLDATPFPIALVDTQDNNILFWSHSALTLFGHTAPTASEWYQIAYPDPDYQREVIDRWKPLLEKARESGQAVNTGEYRVTCSDGSIRVCELYAFFLKDTLIVTFNDITTRKQVENELKQSEERYRSVFENAQEGIYRSTPEGRIIMANQAMTNMFGYKTPEELITSISDVTYQIYVNPEERAKIKKIIEEQGFVSKYETQFYRKDGSIYWVSIIMHAVYDERGQLLYYEGMNEDITIRKEGIERMRKALGATVQAIAVIVETRDPYTAGHQRRVADLARSIAMEMNLSTDQIDGIRMAAAIHDLGKISVPAEILSKPTKLTALEFSLIKTHAQSGYDILTSLFPLPG